jgi:general stress protein CsbA
MCDVKNHETFDILKIQNRYVAFAIVYFVVEASYEHRYLRLLYSITFYALALAIAGLAYQEGFNIF